MKKIEVYSEKLGTKIVVSENVSEDNGDENIVFEDTDSSLVGWMHGGWNNDNGGAGW